MTFRQVRLMVAGFDQLERQQRLTQVENIRLSRLQDDAYKEFVRTNQ